MAGAADPKNPALLGIAAYALKNGVNGNRAETEVLLDWHEVSEHKNADGRVDGVVTEVGQTKVRLARSRARAAGEHAWACSEAAVGAGATAAAAAAAAGRRERDHSEEYSRAACTPRSAA